MGVDCVWNWWYDCMVFAGPIPMMIGAELFRQGPRPLAMAVAGVVNWLGTFTIAMGFESVQVRKSSVSILSTCWRLLFTCESYCCQVQFRWEIRCFHVSSAYYAAYTYLGWVQRLFQRTGCILRDVAYRRKVGFCLVHEFCHRPYALLKSWVRMYVRAGIDCRFTGGGVA